MFAKIPLTGRLPTIKMKVTISDQPFGFKQQLKTPEQIHWILNKATYAFKNKKYCSALLLNME